MKPFILFIVFSFVFFPIMAQNHYWNQQYGATNTLCGGAEVAGVRDNSALFYNPGAMGFITTNKISLSANIYEANIVKLKNVAGEGRDAQSFRALIYPQFIGGSYVFKKAPKLKIIYATMMRNRSSVRFSVQNEMNYDVIKGSPGLEYYKSRLDFDYHSIETWGGIGFGYRINDHFSTGVSLFASYTNLETITTVALSADAEFATVPYIATVDQYASLRMDHVNFIGKIGFAADFKPFLFGLTITLPSAKIFGTGTMTKSLEGHNLNLHSTDTVSPFFQYPSFLVSDQQKGLSTQYKQPASFAIGAEYKWKRVKLKFACEYFLSLPSYEVVHGKEESYIRPTSAYGGKTLKGFMVVKTNAVQVFNVSIGGAFRFVKNFKVLTGFRTDFNNRMSFSPTQLNVGVNSFNPSYWHLMHFGLGVSYNKGASDITVGFNYAFGIAADRRNGINLNDPTQEGFLRGETEKNLRTNVNNIGLIIGYTYYFRSNLRGNEDTKQQQVIEW